MPLIIVPVTVTDSTGGAASCACAALAIVRASAPNDAPHNNAQLNRLPAFALKIMNYLPFEVPIVKFPLPFVPVNIASLL
jgi:hypothetical protein